MSSAVQAGQTTTPKSADIARVTPARVLAAQALARQDKARSLVALNEIFREGTAPATLDGPCNGQLVVLDLAPGVTALGNWLLGLYMPWLGKTFDHANSRGANILRSSSKTLAHVLFPFYHAYTPRDEQTFLAFNFRTYIAAGKEDLDRQVLKIDYESQENPPLSIRRVLDELVQIEDNYYLGKAHLHAVTGGWKMVAFFALQRRA